MKVAFDENIPLAMVRVFQALANERQVRHLTAGLAIEAAGDYTPRPGDDDYSKRNDEPWIRRFSRADGRVIISGNTKMMQVPHERLALVEEGMIVIFFENKRSEWKFCSKCALLLHWWPVIVRTVKKAKPGSFWRVPCSWEADGTLRQLSSEDHKLVQIERQLAARPAVAAARKARRRQAASSTQWQLNLPPRNPKNPDG